MSQSLWLFDSCLTMVADRTTTAGQYDPIEESRFLAHKCPFIPTRAIPNYYTCCPGCSWSLLVKTRSC